ncbi:ankyrin repeat-containing domain protein [Rhexocercosporidium sp. MPI-PUGE-AT-0058]|nr:ankyrin repeat-containing domain protein [Rhexocercosporidium sp. MPI-PUGE-AT-0058]
MSETTFPKLRSARNRSIPDRPRSPTTYKMVEVNEETSFFVSRSDSSWSQDSPFRTCSVASKILRLCKSGDLDQARALITELPDWVGEDFSRQGLENALEAGDVEAARFFLEQGAKLNVSGGTMIRPVLLHARSSQSLQRPPFRLSIPDVVLKIAQIKHQAVEFFELLVEYGWDVNTPGFGGMTAIEAAIPNTALIRTLLRLGADPNFGSPQKHKLNAIEADHESGSALDRAAFSPSSSSITIIDLLLQAGAKIEYSVALHLAAEAPKELGENRVMIEHLLKRGWKVDEMDRQVRGLYGRGSPLMCATRLRRVERVKVLLEHSADPYLKNWRGETPVGEAQNMKCVALLELFEEFAGPRDGVGKTENGL